ncbi:hypothetical protein LJC23_01185 [Desulfovibrio sp. OttesenSCG-928-I05]|nr:hypothetical protein [Desulfovibrio sp. OttesenSCG-928-I05]
MRRFFHFSLVFSLLLSVAALAGCGVTGKGTVKTLDPALVASARDSWDDFLKVSRNADALSGPFRLSANLHYAGDEGTQRVSAYFWGNGAQENPHPLRLDIQGGMGTVMAAVREDASSFMAYIPSDNAVYLSPSGTGSLEAFGVPVPFSLADLALLFNGRYEHFFLGAESGTESGEHSAPAAFQNEDGVVCFALAEENGARFAGTLVLGAGGLPLSWTEQGENGWTLLIDYPADSTRTTPRRVRFKHAGGKQATVVVRDLARTEPFRGQQLELTFPQGTEIRILQPR